MVVMKTAHLDTTTTHPGTSNVAVAILAVSGEPMKSNRAARHHRPERIEACVRTSAGHMTNGMCVGVYRHGTAEQQELTIVAVHQTCQVPIQVDHHHLVGVEGAMFEEIGRHRQAMGGETIEGPLGRRTTEVVEEMM